MSHLRKLRIRTPAVVLCTCSSIGKKAATLLEFSMGGGVAFRVIQSPFGGAGGAAWHTILMGHYVGNGNVGLLGWAADGCCGWAGRAGRCGVWGACAMPRVAWVLVASRHACKSRDRPLGRHPPCRCIGSLGPCLAYFCLPPFFLL